MSREWEPGDVAIIETGHNGGKVSLVVETFDGCPNVAIADETEPLAYGADELRPLVVIDPEDAEQVDRLVRLMCSAFSHRESAQAALREYANPTPAKPDEPTGLGAVVETASGRRYVRTYGPADTDDYQCWKPDVFTNRVQWSEFEAIRVLSEGVQP